MVELNYNGYRETIIIQPIEEQHVTLTPEISGKILENVKKTL